MTEVYEEDKPTPFTPTTRKQLIQVALLGATVGLVVWGLTMLLDTFVFKAILCQADPATRCAQAPQYAGSIASIIGIGIGLFGLVKLQIFRPLLAALAASLSLWGLASILAILPSFGNAFSHMFLYLLAYLVFVWIARIRLFWLVILVQLAIVITIRLILNS